MLQKKLFITISILSIVFYAYMYEWPRVNAQEPEPLPADFEDTYTGLDDPGLPTTSDVLSFLQADENTTSATAETDPDTGGTTVTVPIGFTNISEETVDAVVLTVPLTPGETLPEDSPWTEITLEDGSRVAAFNIGSLGTGQSAELLFVFNSNNVVADIAGTRIALAARLDATDSAGNSIALSGSVEHTFQVPTNVKTVVPERTFTPTPTPRIPTATPTPTPTDASSMLLGTVIASPETVQRGMPLTFTILVTNFNNVPAENVTVIVKLPEGTTFNEVANAGFGWEPVSDQPNTYQITLGQLAAEARDSRPIIAVVNNDVLDGTLLHVTSILDGDGFEPMTITPEFGSNIGATVQGDGQIEQPDGETQEPTNTSLPTPTLTLTPRPTATVESGDAYEPNNSCTLARQIPTDGAPQTHSFHISSDTDWATFTASAPGTYRVEVNIPENSRADVDLYYYTECDSFHAESFTETFAPGARLDVEAEQAGQQFYIRVKNFDALQFGRDVTYNLSVRQMTNQQSDDGEQLIPGPAIVVAGRYRGTDSVQDNIDQTALAAYDLFVAKGRKDSEIFFLTTNSSLDNVDGDATERNLEHGITTWAKEQLEKENVAQVLTLYLVDHGGPDEFYLDRLNQEILTPNDLDNWLSELEAEFPDLLVNVIIEACRAGSFIERQNGSISKPGRVIITSSSASYDAFVSRYGAHFSDNFLTFLLQEQNLGYSFQESRNIVQRFHSRQDPWIDADGDGEPNELNDIAQASRRSFDQAGTLGGEWPPYIAAVSASPQGTALKAEVRHKGGNQEIEAVWAVVYPPSYTPPTGEAAYEDDGELNAEELDVIEFQADGEASYVESEAYTGFTETGVYRVVVHARDAKGLVAQSVTVAVDTRYRVYLPMISR